MNIVQGLLNGYLCKLTQFALICSDSLAKFLGNEILRQPGIGIAIDRDFETAFFFFLFNYRL